jgi:DNA-directed RNA polymerase subunit beta'
MANLNPEGAFGSLKDRVKVAISQQFPYEGQKHRLELVDIEIRDDARTSSAPNHIDNIQSQYDAKTRGRTWAVPIRASLRLVDIETGKELDSGTITLARLPKITRRYTYIVDGHERQHDSVFRLKSRPYHLIADNGAIRAYWNLAKGHGFDLNIDPNSGVMKMKLGTSNIPLYRVLQSMGVSDEQMRNAWGSEVMATNQKRSKPQDILKVHKVLAGRGQKGYKPPTVAEAEEYTRKTFNETRLRPDAMEAAFGKPYDRVNGENLLLSSVRILNIAKGTGEEDDRQSLSAKDIAGTEDFIVEAIEKKTTELRRRVFNNLDRQNKISAILSPNAYTKVIKGVFAHSQLPDQTNPLQFVSGYLRTTLRGSEFGGVKGEHAALDRDKLLNPSHLGFLDPIQTPESEDTGIVLHLPLGARKEGKELKIKVYDVKAKKWVDATPGLLEQSVVAYPDQVRWPKGKQAPPVPIASEVAVYDNERNTSKRDWSEVQYVLASAKGLFSFSANLIPFLQNNNGSRAMMGAKQQEQAVSLKHREAPLVQTKSESWMTFERILGMFNSHQAQVGGKVIDVQPGKITIKARNGKISEEQIYDHYPLNGGKNMLNSEPTVKVGDEVKAGDTVADTNYTKDGQLSLGTNMRVAYAPFHGLNFEDGIVVSESAAEKMTSHHMHAESVSIFPGMLVDKKRWVDYSLPERATPERLAKVGDDGVIKEGSEVISGDILVALLGPSPKTKDDQELANIHRSLVRDYKDRALIWDHDYPGKVAKVIRTGKKITVHVRTDEKLVVGDKLSGRHGNKGIVSRIIPDHEMPHDKEGNPVHILLNPAGVPSRINVGQVLETAASKIAKKTGKPYVIENFSADTDYLQKVKDDLKKHGLSDTEELFDPATNKSMGQVMVGEQYTLKLHHMVDKKMTARSHGGAYTHKGQPPGGSGIPGGGQKLDTLATYAMLAHGANANLREAYTYKSDQDQDEVWIAVQTGRPLPDPKPTRGMRMFQDYLKGMGVHVEKKGDKYLLSPMTDKQTLKMSNGHIKFPDKALRAKGIRTIEEAGGLFDPKVTGGLEGKFWGHIKLEQRVPNPVFEKAILALTGIKKKEFEELVGPDGLRDGKAGFEVINNALENIDVDKDLKELEDSLPSLKGPQLNKAYRKVRYLRNLKKLGITPVEAYTNEQLPVVPPSTRRVSIGLDGKQIFDDLNGLYWSVGQINEQLRTADPSTPRSERQKMQSHLYDAVRALRISGMDMGDGRKSRHHFGLMEKMTGSQPKQSFFQDGVMSRRQDLSGRSTIIPAPEMGLDEVGLPLPVAMEMYKPFIVRELHKNRGFSPLQAQKLVKKKDKAAVDALHQVVAERPVLMKRDPALHKFSIMAFNPRITSGKAISIHPLVTGGFNADFDGDTMALYVPVSDKAVDEAKKTMLPSKNLFSPTHGGLMTVPGQDSLLGLYQTTAWGKRIQTPKGATAASLVQMLHAGKVNASDVVTLGGKQTTVGRLALNEDLPAGMKGDPRLLYDKNFRLNKGQLKKYLGEIARRFPNEFPKTVDSWKDYGNKLSYMHGSSFSLDDFHDGRSFRNDVLKKYEREENKIRKSGLTTKEKDAKIVQLYVDAGEELKHRGAMRYDKKGNKVYDWVSSGAKGNWTQFAQMVFGAMIVVDAKNRPVPVPIKKSFGEGLSVPEYWASLHGARKGTLDRAAGTRDPGSLTKDLINTVINYSVTSEDCGTTNGVSLDPNDGTADVADRYLAKAVTLKGGEVIPEKTLLSPPVLSRIKNSGVKRIIVRSPLHCRQAKGICSMCYGLNENGKHYENGVNVGIIAGHALGEPVTQMTMRTFHTGGVAGDEGAVDYFKRAKQLFFVPKTLPDAATLTTVTGTVGSVTQNQALGGWDVVVGGKLHRVPARSKLLDSVKPGVMLKKGDPLSKGPINPHQMLEQTKNIHAVRGYMTDELMKVYPGGTRRRNVETVIRAMTNLSRVEHAPGHPEYTRGQLTPLSELEHKNRTARQGGMPPIQHTPLLRPMTQMPLDGQEDWMARLNYRKLKETFQEGAAQGWASDIHGHPIPGLAHGAEFGTKMPTGMQEPAPRMDAISTPKTPEPKPQVSGSFFDRFRRFRR